MLGLLIYFIVPIFSEVVLDGNTLRITGEFTVTPDMVSQYKSATNICKISSQGDLTIQESTFTGFSSLKQLEITTTGSVTFTGLVTDVSTLALFISCTTIQSLSTAFPVVDSYSLNVSDFQSQSTQNIKAKNITIESQQQIQFCLDSNLKQSIQFVTLTGNVINLEQQSFQEVSNLQMLKIRATGEVNIKLDSFLSSEIENIDIESGGAINIEQQAFQNCANIDHLRLVTNAEVNLKLDSFLHSKIEHIYIRAEGPVNFEQQAFQQVYNTEEMYVYSNDSINFKLDSFIRCQVATFIIELNGTINFEQQCFQETYNLQNFTVIARDTINFKLNSFISSSVVNATLISTNGSIYFGQQAFQNCRNLTYITIKAAGNVTFGLEAFAGTDVEFIYISPYEEENKLRLLSSSNNVVVGQNSFMNCKSLQEVSIRSDGDIEIQQGAFAESQNLRNVDLKASQKVAVQTNAFQNCKSLTDVSIDASQTQVDDGAYNGCDNLSHKKKGGLSGGAIAGIVIACIVVAAVAAFCVYWFVFRKKDDEYAQAK